MYKILKLSKDSIVVMKSSIHLVH